MKAAMQTMARGYGDRSARNRLGSDITLREPRPPQGIVIVTAEFAPDIGESGTARLFCIEMKPGGINLPFLTEAQDKALEGKYAACMRGYTDMVKFFADKGEVCGILKSKFMTYRSKWRERPRENEIQFHDRLPDTLACLKSVFLYGDISIRRSTHGREGITALNERFENVLLYLAARQSESIEQDRPTHIFLRKLYSLIECGQVCLIPASSRLETLPKNYIGYEDETYYYLMLDASHKAVKRLCGEQDEGFAISAKSLAKALADEGLIEPGDNGTNTRTMRFGGRLKRVMLLHKEKANKLVSV